MYLLIAVMEILLEFQIIFLPFYSSVLLIIISSLVRGGHYAWSVDGHKIDKYIELR